MKSGDLKSIVISVLTTDIGYSIKDIKEQVDKKSDKSYAYTTISTVLERLKTDTIAILRKAKINGRTKNLYYLSESGYKKEVKNVLYGVIQKFGVGGVKHLGELLNADIDDDYLNKLQKELEL